MKKIINFKEFVVLLLFISGIIVAHFCGFSKLFIGRWIALGFLFGMLFEVCTANAWEYDVRDSFFVTLGDISFIIPLGWTGIILICLSIEKYIFPLLSIENLLLRQVVSYIIAFSPGGLFEIFLFSVIKLWNYNWDNYLLKYTNIINGKKIHIFGVPLTIVVFSYQPLIGLPCLFLGKLFGWIN